MRNKKKQERKNSRSSPFAHAIVSGTASNVYKFVRVSTRGEISSSFAQVYTQSVYTFVEHL